MRNILFYTILSFIVYSADAKSLIENADIGEFPFQVSLEIGGFHHCGGSILNSTIILTSAHCTHLIKHLDSLKIRAGSIIREQGGTVQDVEVVFKHELWNDRTFDYDVSLIVLKKPLQFSSTISPISLPNENEYVEGEETVVVTGWGTKNTHVFEWPKSIRMILRKAYIEVMDQKNCKEVHSSFADVTPRMMCAGLYGADGKDVCSTDSGGPLVSENKLHGITSWNIGCVEKWYPGVYTRVTTIRDWIRKKVNL